MAISANQVTMARILLLPLPVYLLIYGNQIGWWVAFFLMVILGATDFVDGMMARRDGPTVLGSLIDPVADKIFITAVFLTLAAIGIFPGWVAAVILSREFIVTALRSSVAFRAEKIKTSKLAKIKTIIQMGGAGTIFLTISLPKTYGLVTLVLALGFYGSALIYYVNKRKPPYWAIPVGASFTLLVVLWLFFSEEVAIYTQCAVIAALTWLSALDYFRGTYKIFLKTGMYFGDWIRIFWSVIYSILITPLVSYFPIMIMPIFVAISLEFGLGGIDNIVVAKKNIFNRSSFVFSSIFGLAFALAVNLALFLDLPAQPFYFSLALALLSSIVCGATFGRHANIFR